MPKIPIIGMALSRTPEVSELAAALRLHGYELVDVPAVEKLPDWIRKSHGAPILVYGAPDIHVRDVLKAAAGVGGSSPVIILVDRSEFDQYYEFMCEGAWDYFEVAEGPEAIERALEYALRRSVAA